MFSNYLQVAILDTPAKETQQTQPGPPTEGQLIQQAVADMKLVAMDPNHQTASNLLKAESDFSQLQKLDGGASTAKFLATVDGINTSLHGASYHDNYLPGLYITGINSEGHLTVFDDVNKVNAVLADSVGVVGPVGAGEQINDSLYVDSKDPVRDNIITPFAIHQGALGDCTFIAALSSLAQNNPEAIKQMIQDNGVQPDGTRTYTVTFPGDKDNPIVVSAPTRYEVNEFMQDLDGMWANVLEKAFRKHTGRELHNPGMPGDIAMQLLTGKQPENVGFPKADTNGVINQQELDKVKQQLQQSLEQGKCVTVASYPTLSLPVERDASGQLIANLVPNHMYSVMAFNPSTNMVTLRNPWDYNKTVAGGTIFGGVTRLSFQDLLKDFGGMVVSG